MPAEPQLTSTPTSTSKTKEEMRQDMCSSSDKMLCRFSFPSMAWRELCSWGLARMLSGSMMRRSQVKLVREQKLHSSWRFWSRLVQDLNPKPIYEFQYVRCTWIVRIFSTRSCLWSWCLPIFLDIQCLQTLQTRNPQEPRDQVMMTMQRRHLTRNLRSNSWWKSPKFFTYFQRMA